MQQSKRSRPRSSGMALDAPVLPGESTWWGKGGGGDSSSCGQGPSQLDQSSMWTPSGVQTPGPRQSARFSQGLSTPAMHCSNQERSLKILISGPHPQRALERSPVILMLSQDWEPVGWQEESQWGRGTWIWNSGVTLVTWAGQLLFLSIGFVTAKWG